MTDTISEAADTIKKDVENDVHPIVKSLWADFKGDLSEFKAWITKEIEKL